jgi:N-acyl-D-amino-acid deacylase
MGQRAFDSEATEEDLNAMRRQLVDALDAGAVGFTTSRSPSHETSDDRPVASRLAGCVRASFGGGGIGRDL